MGDFFTALSKNTMFTKFKLLVWRKWFILNHLKTNWIKPAVTIFILLIEAFCPCFSKEIRAVSLLQLKVVVVHHPLCISFIPVFWGCSNNCVIPPRKGFGFSHCAGHSSLGNLEKWDTEGCVVSYLWCKAALAVGRRQADMPLRDETCFLNGVHHAVFHFIQMCVCCWGKHSWKLQCSWDLSSSLGISVWFSHFEC